ncbi:MAG: cellulose-binding protein [Jatrophihabitantaceae bacterium]|nr:cellulose-binding protein [Jatrophihabitantaceae bacterium]
MQGWGFFDGPTDAATIATMKSWGVNAVRIPMNEDCWLAINGTPAARSGVAYQTAIADYVQRLHDQGMYVILDLHWSHQGATLATGQNNMADKDHSVAFWSEVAAAYRADTMALFDLYNEPHDITWSVWKNGDSVYAGMDELIAAIRGTGATNWVIASGLAYGNDDSQWLANRPVDPAGKLAAGAHIYSFNACVTAACWSARFAPIAAQVPFYITEMGEDDCTAAFVTRVFEWSDANGIDGYAPWAWNSAYSCAGGPSLISANDGSPTAYGAGVRSYYLAHK